MRAHVLRMAVTLYENGTLELPAAARTAGVSPDRMHRCLQSNGVTVREQSSSIPEVARS